MSNAPNTKKPSLGLAIVLLILFWPVGLYLLYRYFTNDKAEVFKNSKVLRNFSIVFVILAILGVATSGFQMGTIVFWIFFLVGGVFMFYQSMETKKAAGRYKVYIDLIVNDENDNIDTIANRASLSSALVEKDLEKMIKLGIFQGAELNTVKRTIEIRRINTNEGVASADAASSGVISVKCPNCGATVGVTEGQSIECEYCGTVLQGK